MTIVILDLEWNTAFSVKKERFVNEIIEFGAVKLNENLEITDEFQMFVKSKLTRKLRGRVKELTHITNEDLIENGQDYLKVINLFKQWAGDDTLIMTWSNSDLYVLYDNCHCFTKYDNIPFLNYYCDLQKYIQNYLKLDDSHQIGLSSAAEILKIDSSDIDLHRACGDSRLCALILQKCYDPQMLNSFVSFAGTPEFYERLVFKPYIVSDINNPLIDPNDLRLKCQTCGNHLRRKSPWKFKNKNFCAVFACRTCDKKFDGKIQIKKLYDGISIRKSVSPHGDEDETVPIVEKKRIIAK